MRSFQFITPHGDGKIERSWWCDIFDGLRLRICYFTTGDVYEGLRLRTFDDEVMWAFRSTAIDLVCLRKL